MKFLSKSLVLGCTLFAFGCVDSDPEYKAEKARQRAEHSQQSTQLAKAEFGPLLPICLKRLERGVVTGPKEMAKLGFRRNQISLASRESYVKPRGQVDSVVFSSANTSIAFLDHRCIMGLGGYVSVQEGGMEMRELLQASGYKYTTNIGGSKFVFEKGTTKLILTGQSSHGITHYVIEKKI